MYNFILEILIFSSLGFTVYLFARGVARVDETAPVSHPAGFFDRMLRRLPLDRIDERLNSFLEKILRRLRVLVLKLDNWVNGSLAKLKKPGEKKKTGAQGADELFSSPKDVEKSEVLPLDTGVSKKEE